MRLVEARFPRPNANGILRTRCGPCQEQLVFSISKRLPSPPAGWIDSFEQKGRSIASLYLRRRIVKQIARDKRSSGRDDLQTYLRSASRADGKKNGGFQ
jgi:hypothetical protein